MSSGQRLLVERRSARKNFIVKRQVALNLSAKFCPVFARHEIELRSISLLVHGPFCKRKRAQQAAVMYSPAKPPAGRFCCFRTCKLKSSKNFFALPSLSAKEKFPRPASKQLSKHTIDIEQAEGIYKNSKLFTAFPFRWNPTRTCATIRVRRSTR